MDRARLWHETLHVGGRLGLPTISEAIGAAADGATIRVHPGLYRENLLITRAVTIMGDGPVAEIVLAPPPHSGPAISIHDEGDALVRGLAIHECYDLGVDVAYDARAELDGLDISATEGGVIVRDGARATVTGCLIHDGYHGGISVVDAGPVTLERNVIRSNQGEGIYVSALGLRAEAVVVRGNVIEDNAWAGIEATEGSIVVVDGNRIQANAKGSIWICGQVQLTLGENELDVPPTEGPCS